MKAGANRAILKLSDALTFAEEISHFLDTSEVRNRIDECPEAALGFATLAGQASDHAIEQLSNELSNREELHGGEFYVLAWCVRELILKLKKSHPQEWE